MATEVNLGRVQGASFWCGSVNGSTATLTNTSDLTPQVGDLVLDTTTGSLYSVESVESNTSVTINTSSLGNLTGPQGERGEDGADGTSFTGPYLHRVTLPSPSIQPVGTSIGTGYLYFITNSSTFTLDELTNLNYFVRGYITINGLYSLFAITQIQTLIPTGYLILTTRYFTDSGAETLTYSSGESLWSIDTYSLFN